MNKFIKVSGSTLGMFVIIFGVLMAEKSMDFYSVSGDTGIQYLILFAGLLIYNYSRD